MDKSSKLLMFWTSSVHYHFYMNRRDFWYRKDLQEADKNFCLLASNIQKKLGVPDLEEYWWNIGIHQYVSYLWYKLKREDI